MISRRGFVAAVALSGCAPRVLAQAKNPRIGFLYHRGRASSMDQNLLGAFLRGLGDLGYVEGKNLTIEWRYAEGKYERLPAMAAELVKLKVDLIVAANPPCIQAARKATGTIPIVMISAPDPVASGFIKSLARPGGNVSGLANLVGDLASKHVELLRVVLPKLIRFAALNNPDNPGDSLVRKQFVTTAAKQHGLTAIFIDARNAQELDGAFAAAVNERAEGVIVPADGVLLQQRAVVGELALKHRLPTVCVYRENVEAGALISYGPDLAFNYRHAASYVDRILKGAKPADLPVEQVSRLHTAVNLRTAKALGLTLPREFLLRADELIE